MEAEPVSHKHVTLSKQTLLCCYTDSDLYDASYNLKHMCCTLQQGQVIAYMHSFDVGQELLTLLTGGIDLFVLLDHFLITS